MISDYARSLMDPQFAAELQSQKEAVVARLQEQAKRTPQSDAAEDVTAALNQVFGSPAGIFRVVTASAERLGTVPDGEPGVVTVDLRVDDFGFFASERYSDILGAACLRVLAGLIVGEHPPVDVPSPQFLAALCQLTHRCELNGIAVDRVEAFNVARFGASPTQFMAVMQESGGMSLFTRVEELNSVAIPAEFIAAWDQVFARNTEFGHAG